MKRSLAILLLGLCAPLLAVAARPAWVEGSASDATIRVATIEAGSGQDLVVLDGGLEGGLRRGMVLLADAQGTRKGRLLVAEATSGRAVALILELAPGQILEPGDTIRPSLIRL